MRVERNEIGVYTVLNGSTYYTHRSIEEKFGMTGMSEYIRSLPKIMPKYVFKVSKPLATIAGLDRKENYGFCVYFVHEDLVPILVTAYSIIGKERNECLLNELFGSNKKQLVITTINK